MKIHNYILIIFLLFNGYINAQVGVSTENIHGQAVLDIKNSAGEMIDPNESKALKFPSVDNTTQLPLYNSGASDLFDDDPTMKGMLMYVKDKKELYFYNGQRWLPVVDAKGNETRVSSSAIASFGCTLGICGSAYLGSPVKPCV